MKAICFYFQIHQPFRLKTYHFSDIGNDHYYYADFTNEDIITRISQRSYLPANEMLLDMIKENGKNFKVAFSISGTTLEQFELYVPEWIDSMKALVDTGCVEILSETYSHSLASLADPEEFRIQVKAHDEKIFQLFGQHPKVFRNTELIYSDDISFMIHDMGFKGALIDGAKHILGWKSPNYIYSSAVMPKLKLMLKNSKLSDDISFRFSNTDWTEFPLTADKFIGWINDLPQEEQIINLFMNYDTFGELQSRETGIFEFMKALPRFAKENGVAFWTPSETLSKLKPVSELAVPYPMSWADEARDTSAWLGNTLQKEAFNKLYSISERVHLCDDRRIKQDWYYLQNSDHFFYMSTKHQNDGAIHSLYSPYETPYQAFTNYMNVLSDFIVRVEEQYPLSIENEELNALLTTIRNQSAEIEQLNREVALMRNNILKAEDGDLDPIDKDTDKAKPTKKPVAKKSSANSVQASKKASATKPTKAKPAPKPAKKKAKK